MTKSPLKKDSKTKILQMKAKRWVFTVQGATDKQYENLKNLLDDSDDVSLAVFAREAGQHGNHPHFQGYLECTTQTRMLKRFRDALGDDSPHLDPAKGTRNQNLNYVYAVDKPYEIGWIRYRKGEFPVPDRYQDDAATFIETFKPRPFQQEILDICESPSEPRSIYWFYEPQGNVGKTSICEYLTNMYGALLVDGRPGDIKHAFARMREIAKTDPSIVLVDLARSARITKTLITCIESLKNGLFFSGKYESGMIRMKKKPHVIVFANVPPTKVIESLSADRWKIREILPDYSTKGRMYTTFLKKPSKRKKTP